MAAPDVVLEMHLPARIYQVLRAGGYDKAALSEDAREGLAVRLYAERRLSIGQAAEMAGLPLVRFMDLLRLVNVPVAEYGQEEYCDDLDTIGALLSEEPV